MKRLTVIALIFFLTAPFFVFPVREVQAAPTVIYLTNTAATTWAVPSDWNNSNNTIEVIGGGGRGHSTNGGAGGGAYSKISNQTLSGTVGIAIGAGATTDSTAGGDTYLCTSTSNCASIADSAVVVGAKGGGARNGGDSASGVGTTKYSGGDGGGNGGCGDANLSGGGGAAGPLGAGGNGGTGSQCAGGNGGGGGGGNGGGGAGGPNTNFDGGTGGNNFGGTGGGAGGSFGVNGTAGTDGGGGGGGGAGAAGAQGGAGTEWDATHGSGGGGGSGTTETGPGGAGALYGGGGGGSRLSTPGNGAQGIIVITYTPAATRTSLSRPPNNLGLVAYWPFNEGTSTIAGDFSGNGYVGTLTNSPTWSNGKIGRYSVRLNGAEYVDTPLAQQFGDFTACIWFYSTGNISSARIMDKNYITGFWIGRSTTVSDQWGGGIIEPDSPYGRFVTLSDNAWHHICSVRSGTTHTIYGDGGNVSTSGTVSGATIDSSTLRLGAIYSDPANNYFSGYIDDARIYNRALTAGEVRTLYNNSRAVTVGGSEKLKVASGLVGHWTFNGNDLTWSSETAGTAYDRSGGGNHGTLTNMNQLTSAQQGKLGQALNFDGTDDYVNTNYAPNLTGDFSFSLWYKSDQTSFASDKDLLASATIANRVVQLEVDGDGSRCPDDKIGLLTTDDGGAFDIVCTTSSVNDTDWHFIAATYDVDGNMLIYRDGIQENSSSVTSNSNAAKDFSGYPFYIGATNFGGVTQEYFDGLIDDVRAYDRVLTASEVKQLYQMGYGVIIRSQ